MRDTFLRCCTADGESMLAAMPDQRLVATNFNDNLSLTVPGPNAAMTADGASDLLRLDGTVTEALSAPRPAGSLELPSYTEYAADFVLGKFLPHTPLDIAKLLAEAT